MLRFEMARIANPRQRWNLADYGVTEAMITDAETSLDDFKALIGKPRTIRNQAFAAMSLLEELFDSANDLLKNRLDPIDDSL